MHACNAWIQCVLCAETYYTRLCYRALLAAGLDVAACTALYGKFTVDAWQQQTKTEIVDLLDRAGIARNHANQIIDDVDNFVRLFWTNFTHKLDGEYHKWMLCLLLAVCCFSFVLGFLCGAPCVLGHIPLM